MTRFGGGFLTVMVVLAVSLLLAAAPAGAAEIPTPSCAEGPTREGDTIVGTPCADYIVVPPNVAYVDGGPGNDTIVAAEGPVTRAEQCTTPHCGVGSQEFNGGSGNDTVFGERGNDILRGGEGNDRLYGGIGDDLLEGGPGEDLLSGGFGADTVDGGEGSDFVRGDGTIDRILDTGATGTDTLSYSTGATPGFGNVPGATTLSTEHPGFPSTANGRGVYLNLAATEGNGNDGAAADGGGVDDVRGSDFERIVGTPFADYIVGSKPGQQIYGGGGGDVLVAGAGSQLTGGADNDDCYGGASTSCESPSPTGPASRAEPEKIEVGEMVEGATDQTELYLVSAESTATSDGISVTASTSPSVTFHRSGGAAFATPASGSGCTLVSAAEVTCALSAPLDSVTVAGLGGNDNLAAPALAEATSLVLLGGRENDVLNGGAVSDDTLVDGPGEDALHGGAGDDALLNGEGRDELLGEGGNDLLISTVVCEGDLIDGGEGRDNASWAKYKGSALGGVDARLDQRLAGEPKPGSGGEVSCPAGHSMDQLTEVEDLEGSPESDYLFGDGGPNQLLGHQGEDTYHSGAGEDLILANSKSKDAVIDCGPDLDEAVLDLPEIGDPAPIECEKIRNAPPGEYEVPPELTTPPVVAPAPTPPVTPPPPAPKPDRTAPQTKLLRRPAKLIRVAPRHLAAVVLRFAASERSTFECKLDAKPYRRCRSPLRAHLKPGAHTFRVYAVDAAGNRDKSPAILHLRVVSRRHRVVTGRHR